MEIRSKEEIERENVKLRHQYKMLKLKYNIVNGALQKINRLTQEKTITTNQETPTTTNNAGGPHGH
jgi:hypothetical protein